ncbi:MAG: aspartate aminotransferase family protein, partial [Luminiphilus sp.]|nr:aspartate aminotransferase family protein [Luminiphilus sp.]
TQAYTEAVERSLQVTAAAAEMIEAHPNLEMVVPSELSICVFRRVGWSPEEYAAWSDKLLAEGLAFVTPTKHEGETVLRFCIVNPRTGTEDIRMILDTL